MIEQVLERRNLNRAYKRVVANKGAGGADGMQVSDLKSHLQHEGARLIGLVRSGSYQPKPIQGITIPKSNGKQRLLGVPTVVDRVLQQALLQVLEPLFEPDFRPHSYGFRPGHERAIPQGEDPGDFQVREPRSGWEGKSSGATSPKVYQRRVSTCGRYRFEEFLR